MANKMGVTIRKDMRYHNRFSPWPFASHLITPYVRGWFQKGDAQLYVNRGIGILCVGIGVDQNLIL